MGIDSQHIETLTILKSGEAAFYNGRFPGEMGGVYPSAWCLWYGCNGTKCILYCGWSPT